MPEEMQRYTAEFKSAIDARMASFDLRPLVRTLLDPRLINPPVNGPQWQVIFYLPMQVLQSTTLDLVLATVHRYGGTTEHFQAVN